MGKKPEHIMIYQRYTHETYQFVGYLKKNIFRVSEKPPGQETGRSLGGTSQGDDWLSEVGDVVRAMAPKVLRNGGLNYPVGVFILRTMASQLELRMEFPKHIWLVVWNSLEHEFYFSTYWECHHPN